MFASEHTAGILPLIRRGAAAAALCTAAVIPAVQGVGADAGLHASTAQSAGDSGSEWPLFSGNAPI